MSSTTTISHSTAFGEVVGEKYMTQRTVENVLAGLEKSTEERQALLIELKRSLALQQLAPGIFERAIGAVRTQWVKPPGTEAEQTRGLRKYDPLRYRQHYIFIVKFIDTENNEVIWTFTYSDVPAVLGGGKSDA